MGYLLQIVVIGAIMKFLWHRILLIRGVENPKVGWGKPLTLGLIVIMIWLLIGQWGGLVTLVGIVGAVIILGLLMLVKPKKKNP